jgi:peptide/nickel transport system substrate-binding protein
MRPGRFVRTSTGLRGRLSRRAFLVQCAASAGIAGLLSACAGQAPAPPPAAPAAPAATATPATARKVETISTPAPATAVAAKPAEKAAAPAAAKVEAKGRLVYAWHTTLSPAWLDPQENPPQITPYNFAYAMHDALVKHMPGKTFAPSLAESYEVAPDNKSATFKLRPGIKFHDGKLVTPEDVKFTYEKYRGANATILKEKTQSIETPDDRTVRFVFKEPFLDFLTIYGSPASGAGWIVPKAYYEQVGPNGFKQNPIGAGPYRFVKQQAGTEIEFEAFPDYWRKSPIVKTIVMRGIPEVSTRVAMLQTGEADVINQLTGEVLDVVRNDSKLRAVPLQAGTAWIEMTSYDSPDHPLTDVRVRQAVSLAIDRQAISDAEMGGMAEMKGNWIPSDWPGSLDRPSPPFDVAKAKQLLAEAGHPNGFDVSAFTPLPPYFSWSERIVSQLRTVNIRTQINTMERAAFYEKLAPGPNRQKGLIMPLSGAPGDAAARIRENAVCTGAFSGICIPDIEERMKKYDSSTDPAERKKLLDEVQAYLLDNYILVPIFRQAFINALGPRIANKAEDIEGAIPQYVYLGPYEDLELKDA